MRHKVAEIDSADSWCITESHEILLVVIAYEYYNINVVTILVPALYG